MFSFRHEQANLVDSELNQHFMKLTAFLIAMLRLVWLLKYLVVI